MGRTLRTISLVISAFVLLAFGVTVVNQTAGVVSLMDRIDPVLGWITLVGLLSLYGGLIGVPVVLFLRLPRSLEPPVSEDDPDFPRHLERLQTRLAANPHLQGETITTDKENLERAIAQLDGRADEIVKETAAIIFLSTAVSQNGKLDGAIVLAAQARMIWKLAHVYCQRPTLKDMTRLYANVAGTAFVAGALEEIDLTEQVQPILSSTISSMAGVIPGFQIAAMILVNSVMTGSANAFLTLRVGMIAKRYCAGVVLPPKGALRRSASAEAAKLLGAIVAGGTAKLSGAIWSAVRSQSGRAIGGVAGSVRGTVGHVGGYAKDAGDRFFRLIQRERDTATAETVEP